MSIERLERILAEKEQEELPQGDGPAFEGGPLRSKLESWKRQFGEVYLTAFEDELYVWRVMTRYEYKMVAAQPNTDQMMREELIAEACVLWPEAFNYAKQAQTKAGSVSVLSEQIMEASNFTRTAIPQRL